MSKWMKDGQLNEAALQTLEDNLLTVTDKIGGLVDLVMGKNLVPAFRCGHSRLLYPADYLKAWGKRYGIGLGPSPVSEALDSDYDSAPPVVDRYTSRITQIMHGLGVTNAQMDFVMVQPTEWEARTTVIAADDPLYDSRVSIILPKQIAKSPAIKALYAEWERRNGPVTNQLRRVG